jgi:hypothetical protein
VVSFLQIFRLKFCTHFSSQNFAYTYRNVRKTLTGLHAG